MSIFFDEAKQALEDYYFETLESKNPSTAGVFANDMYLLCSKLYERAAILSNLPSNRQQIADLDAAAAAWRANQTP